MIKWSPVFKDSKDKHTQEIKTEVNFGKGDVRIGTAHRGSECGVMAFNSDIPHEVGSKEPALSKSIEVMCLNAEVLLTFSNVESVETVIRELNWLKEKMDVSKIIEKNKEEYPK